jgi:Protein of unknown function (DUF3047)
MPVLRSGSPFAERWVAGRRDVSADFQTAFGHACLRLTGVAIAADIDNTGEEARSGFAGFRFVASAGDCLPAQVLTVSSTSYLQWPRPGITAMHMKRIRNFRLSVQDGKPRGPAPGGFTAGFRA